MLEGFACVVISEHITSQRPRVSHICAHEPISSTRAAHGLAMEPSFMDC